MNVKQLKVIKNIILDDHIIKVGEIVDVNTTHKNSWTLFHHTGWWEISPKYFNSEEVLFYDN